MTVEQIAKKGFVHNENPELDRNIKETLRKKFVDFIGFDFLPVFVVNDDLFMASHIVKEATASDALSATIYTTPDDNTKTFMLTSARLSYVKDAVNNSVKSRIEVSVDTQSVNILELHYTTTTAGQDHTNIVFDKPIPIDRGAEIKVFNSGATASIDTTGAITGFLSTKSPE
jgi:hypothetical protein